MGLNRLRSQIWALAETRPPQNPHPQTYGRAPRIKSEVPASSASSGSNGVCLFRPPASVRGIGWVINCQPCRNQTLPLGCSTVGFWSSRDLAWATSLQEAVEQACVGIYTRLALLRTLWLKLPLVLKLCCTPLLQSTIPVRAWTILVPRSQGFSKPSKLQHDLPIHTKFIHDLEHATCIWKQKKSLVHGQNLR